MYLLTAIFCSCFFVQIHGGLWDEWLKKYNNSERDRSREIQSVISSTDQSSSTLQQNIEKTNFNGGTEDCEKETTNISEEVYDQQKLAMICTNCGEHINDILKSSNLRIILDKMKYETREFMIKNSNNSEKIQLLMMAYIEELERSMRSYFYELTQRMNEKKSVVTKVGRGDVAEETVRSVVEVDTEEVAKEKDTVSVAEEDSVRSFVKLDDEQVSQDVVSEDLAKSSVKVEDQIKNVDEIAVVGDQVETTVQSKEYNKESNFWHSWLDSVVKVDDEQVSQDVVSEDLAKSSVKVEDQINNADEIAVVGDQAESTVQSKEYNGESNFWHSWLESVVNTDKTKVASEKTTVDLNSNVNEKETSKESGSINSLLRKFRISTGNFKEKPKPKVFNSESIVNILPDYLGFVTKDADDRKAKDLDVDLKHYEVQSAVELKNKQTKVEEISEVSGLSLLTGNEEDFRSNADIVASRIKSGSKGDKQDAGINIVVSAGSTDDGISTVLKKGHKFSLADMMGSWLKSSNVVDKRSADSDIIVKADGGVKNSQIFYGNDKKEESTAEGNCIESASTVNDQSTITKIAADEIETVQKLDKSSENSGKLAGILARWLKPTNKQTRESEAAFGTDKALTNTMATQSTVSKITANVIETVQKSDKDSLENEKITDVFSSWLKPANKRTIEDEIAVGTDTVKTVLKSDKNEKNAVSISDIVENQFKSGYIAGSKGNEQAVRNKNSAKVEGCIETINEEINENVGTASDISKQYTRSKTSVASDRIGIEDVPQSDKNDKDITSIADIWGSWFKPKGVDNQAGDGVNSLLNSEENVKNTQGITNIWNSWFKSSNEVEKEQKKGGYNSANVIVNKKQQKERNFADKFGYMIKTLLIPDDDSKTKEQTADIVSSRLQSANGLDEKLTRSKITTTALSADEIVQKPDESVEKLSDGISKWFKSSNMADQVTNLRNKVGSWYKSIDSNYNPDYVSTDDGVKSELELELDLEPEQIKSKNRITTLVSSWLDNLADKQLINEIVAGSEVRTNPVLSTEGNENILRSIADSWFQTANKVGEQDIRSKISVDRDDKISTENCNNEETTRTGDPLRGCLKS